MHLAKCNSAVMAAEEIASPITPPYQVALAPESIAGSDLLVSAFFAALSHYKRASVALPFPSEHFSVATAPVASGSASAPTSVKEKDFDGCLRAAEAIPPLRTLASQQTSSCSDGATSSDASTSGRGTDLPPTTHQLLQWLLVPSTRRVPSLRHISMQRFKFQLQQARPGFQFEPPPGQSPTYIFESQSTSGSSPPLLDPIIAYHGTSFERLHSILSTGLQPASGTRLQRNGNIFGDGIYLSTDYNMAFSFCNPANGWSHSALGWRLRALLVCQVENSSTTDTRSDTTLPQHYVLVQHTAAVRITHVLIYCDQLTAPATLQGGATALAKERRRRVDWCLVIVVLYGAFMLLQFALQDRQFRRWLKLGR